MPHTVPFPIPFDEIVWADADPADLRGRLSVTILGTLHYMTFVPVKYNDPPDTAATGPGDERTGYQIGCTDYADQDIDALHGLYEDVSAFDTVEIPGRTGEYVVFMHPSGT